MRATLAILAGTAIVAASPTVAQERPIGAGEDPVLRRDGSQAVAFVPTLGPSAGAADSDRFDWGDAAIGAVGAMGLVLVASTLGLAARHRRQSRLRPSIAS